MDRALVSAASNTGTMAWFARHEARIAWRDWFSMMTAGQRWRTRNVVIGLALFAVFMHFLANSMVGKHAKVGPDNHDALVIISGAALLSWCLVLSQAMESVTRAFYARSDLDLILSSPVASRVVFAVRLAAVACSVGLMSVLIASPFINILVLRGGARWIAAYGVVLALGVAAAAIAIAITVALFRMFGPRRTRLLAQIVAAVIGASFVIGLQIAAILSYGTLSRLYLFETGALSDGLPSIDSPLWLPARAMLGDPFALSVVVAACLLAIGFSIAIFSRRFGDHAMAAAGASQAPASRRTQSFYRFRQMSPSRVLRRKEWTLLLRDPWLMSQSLMQVLYLLPPALLLWLSHREGSGALIVLVPVLVMVSGQLAGGLAWLAISGEDAPELVATAPVTPRRVVRAKVEAVLGCIAIVFAPFLAALLPFSAFHALVAGVGILAAATSATFIQLWFRAQAKRSHFRRRQTSSRLATFAEAFSSISWAGTAALAANETWLAVFAGLTAIGVLAGARWLAPR